MIGKGNGTMAIDQIVLSKYLFQQGQNELSKNTPVSCGLAVSLFQDSVELLARTIAGKCGAKVRKSTPFLELWELMQDAAGNTYKKALPLKYKMSKLNEVRDSFKHSGNLPDVSRSHGFCDDAEEFLREATRRFFDKDFDTISLADLIEDSQVRQVIKEAETSMRRGDFEECLKECAKADRIASGTIVRIAPELPGSFRHFSSLFDRPKSSFAGSWVHMLDSYLRGLRHFSVAVALKLNLPDHIKFHSMIPDAVRSADGSWQFNIKRPATKSDADFCLKYVTRYALAVQDQFEDLVNLPSTETQ
jgi:hypothetical protein